MKTDFELAQSHRYVTKHGRKPAPGVTSVDIIEKGALKWSASEIAVKAALATDRAKVLDEALAALEDPKRSRQQIKSQETGLKVPWREATDEDIAIWWLRGTFDRQWTAKADDGTEVHDLAENLSRGIDVRHAPRLKGFVDAWFLFHDECKPEWIELERILVNPSPLGRDDLEIGGRMDWFAILHGGPFQGLFLGDYKTGGKYVGPVARQAAGYLSMAGMATYLDNGDLGPLEPLPDAIGAVTVYLHADGTYEICDAFEHESRKDATRAFFDLRSALNHHNRIEAIEKKLAKERTA